MEQDVAAANQAFYAAFRGDDFDAMDRLWAQRAPVACVHPGWPPLVGRAPVMASWRAILGQGAPPIRCGAARVLLLGDVAEVVCEEQVGDHRVIATNVFVREDGRWAMVHHHGSHLAADGPDAPDDDDEADGADDDDDDAVGPN